MSPYSFVLELAARSDTGKVRPHNEDSVFVEPSLGIVVLADGMGGYNAGEVASEMATRTISAALIHSSQLNRADQKELDFVLARQVVLDAVAEANALIQDAALQQAGYAGMGTTLVMAWFMEKRVLLAHVGDSRCYRLRAGSLLQLTKDHSLLQEHLDAGLLSAAEVKSMKSANLLTRALGVDPVVEPDVMDDIVMPGDVYLLCSDGLTDMLDDDELLALLGTAPQGVAACAEHLIAQANAAGGRDNISAAVAHVRGGNAPSGWRHWLARLFGRRER